MSRIDDLVRDLPPEMQREVEDFAAFLLQRRQRLAAGDSARCATGGGWSGALSHLRDRFPSGVELQHDNLKLWSRGD